MLLVIYVALVAYVVNFVCIIADFSFLILISGCVAGILGLHCVYGHRRSFYIHYYVIILVSTSLLL